MKQETLSKLGNAIREYKGQIHAPSGRWIVPPKQKAIIRIEKRLTELGIDFEDAMNAIDSFKTHDDMREWMNAIQSKAGAK